MDKSKKILSTKVFWLGLLFFSTILFLIALATKIYSINLAVICLSAVIYKYGDSILFKDYNLKRKSKSYYAEMTQKKMKESLKAKSKIS